MTTDVTNSDISRLRSIRFPHELVVKLGPVSSFDSVEREVVKVTVLNEDGLLGNLYKECMKTFTGVLRHPFSPHVTVCFAKPGQKIAERLERSGLAYHVNNISWKCNNFVIESKPGMFEKVFFYDGPKN